MPITPDDLEGLKPERAAAEVLKRSEAMLARDRRHDMRVAALESDVAALRDELAALRRHDPANG